MDDNIKKILDALPDKPPRSRLEPYRELIEELRRRDRTFREIAEMLAEKCQVQVTGSGIHDFLRTRSRRERRQAKITAKLTQPPVTRSGADTVIEASSGDAVQRKIAELKTRKSASKPDASGFEYDPDEPLRLKKSNQR